MISANDGAGSVGYSHERETSEKSLVRSSMYRQDGVGVVAGYGVEVVRWRIRNYAGVHVSAGNFRT